MVTRNVTFHKPTLIILLGMLIASFLTVSLAEAKEKRSKNARAAVSRKKKSEPHLQKSEPGKVGIIKQNLSTDMTFDDMNISGKRQAPFGTQITVDDEKDIPSLVDYRKNFKDRAELSSSGR